MKQVAAFFVVSAVLYALWKITPHATKEIVKCIVKKHVAPAAFFAAVVTIAMLAFAFFSNGKVI